MVRKSIVGKTFDPNINWPNLDNQYADVIYAIGYIISNWQNVEQLYNKIMDASKLPDALTSLLSEKLNNSEKQQVMRIIGESFESDDNELYKAISTFVRYAGICCANRNFVAHAILEKQKTSPNLILLKKSSSGNLNKVSAQVSGLREMGKSMIIVSGYGQLIHSSLVLGARRTAVKNTEYDIKIELQQEPPQPRVWDDILPKI